MASHKVIYCSLRVERIVRKKYASSTFFISLLHTHVHARAHTHTDIEQGRIDLLTFLQPSCFTSCCVCPRLRCLCAGWTCEHTRAQVFARHGTVIFLIKLMERDKEKKDRGREREGGEANLCFMIWLRRAAFTHIHAHKGC